MSERVLLFQYNSHKYAEKGEVNMIRVYSDNTYTADGRGTDVVEWKLEDNTVWWKRRGGGWEPWGSNDFHEHLMDYLDNQILGVSDV
jgi:hypothetical protein